MNIIETVAGQLRAGDTFAYHGFPVTVISVDDSTANLVRFTYTYGDVLAPHDARYGALDHNAPVAVYSPS